MAICDEVREEFMGADLMFEFKVNLKKARHASPRYHMAKIVNEPRLRQHLILAHQIERALSERKAKDFNEMATWLNMTYARLKQILQLLFLCPKIKEEILLSNSPKICKLTERSLRQIVKEVDWQKQIELWNNLS